MATTKNSTRKQLKSKNTMTENSLAKNSTAKSPGASPSSTTKATQASAASKASAASAAKRFRVLLKQYAGTAATGIIVPFDVPRAFGTRGRVPVRCTVNGFPFRSSVFAAGDGTHYMVINKEVRAGANVKGGQTVSMTMERDTEPRVITPPAELASALKGNKAARAAWDKLSYTHRKEYARAVEEAKKPETRERRVERAIAELSAGKKPR